MKETTWLNPFDSMWRRRLTSAECKMGRLGKCHGKICRLPLTGCTPVLTAILEVDFVKPKSFYRPCYYHQLQDVKHIVGSPGANTH